MSEENKAVVRRLVEEVINQGKLELADQLFLPEFAPMAKQAFGTFRAAFPDWREDIVELVAEGNRVAGHFKCTGTHQGEFMGFSPTGKQMEVDEVYFLTIEGGKIVAFFGADDNLSRLQQLGLVTL
jgi:predicted ester cyclase